MDGLPDGLVVAKDGTIFGSGPGAIYVLTPDGKLIGRMVTCAPSFIVQGAMYWLG